VGNDAQQHWRDDYVTSKEGEKKRRILNMAKKSIGGISQQLSMAINNIKKHHGEKHGAAHQQARRA